MSDPSPRDNSSSLTLVCCAAGFLVSLDSAGDLHPTPPSPAGQQWRHFGKDGSRAHLLFVFWDTLSVCSAPYRMYPCPLTLKGPTFCQLVSVGGKKAEWHWFAKTSSSCKATWHFLIPSVLSCEAIKHWEPTDETDYPVWAPNTRPTIS